MSELQYMLTPLSYNIYNNHRQKLQKWKMYLAKINKAISPEVVDNLKNDDVQNV